MFFFSFFSFFFFIPVVLKEEQSATFAERLAEEKEKWQEQSDADRADIIFQIEQRAQEQVFALQQKVAAFEALNGGRSPGGTPVSPSASIRTGGMTPGAALFGTPSKRADSSATAQAATAAAVAHAVADANLALSGAQHELEQSNKLNNELQRRIKQLQQEALLLEDEAAEQKRRATTAEAELRTLHFNVPV